MYKVVVKLGLWWTVNLSEDVCFYGSFESLKSRREYYMFDGRGGRWRGVESKEGEKHRRSPKGKNMRVVSGRIV